MKDSTFSDILSRAGKTLLVALCVSATAWAQEAPVIELTFAGRGDSDIVESVTVTNLTHPDIAPVTLSGTDILCLADEETITPVESVQEYIGIAQPILTPNPAMGDGTLIFDAKQDGPVRVSIYTTGGMLVDAATLNASEGRNTARIPSQGTGIYIVNVKGQGVDSNTRWICGGTKSFDGIAIGGAAQWADISLPVKYNAPARQTRAAQSVNVVYMEFNPGDILRFEGTSGQMRTIMHIAPESSHPVTFDFFRCQDASGYNYPIVRAGDMLWMLEDLRPQTMTGLYKTSSANKWKGIDDTAAAEFVVGDRAYYTTNGGRMAMPEGWQLPSVDEIYAFVKKLRADTLIVADFLKDRSYNDWGTLTEGPDTIHMQLMAHGYVNENGELTDDELTGAWLTRNTMKRGCPVSFEISDYDSRLRPMVMHQKRSAFAVRGCRPAPSVYYDVLEKMISSSAQSSRRNMPMQVINSNGPLGTYYTFGADRKSVFFDYSFATSTHDASNKCEKRSGILYKNNAGAWVGENKQLVPLDVNGADYQHHLRKVAAQGNADGYENVVYASWGKPFRALYPYGGTPTVAGDDVVYLSIFGDSIHSHAKLNSNRLKLLDASGSDYMWNMPNVQKWSRRRPEVENGNYLSDYRYEYYARAFNLNCIQDQTGDGVEEIVMNVGDKIAVFDGVTMRCLRERRIQSTTTYTGSAHMRFDVADVNGDGYEDIVLLVDEGAYGGHLYVYSKGNVDEDPIFRGTILYPLTFCDVKVGYMSGHDLPEIAILARGTKENSEELKKEGTLIVMRLKYDDKLRLVTDNDEESEQTVDCFYTLSHRNWILGNMNLCFGYFRGRDIIDQDGNTISYNQDLVVGYKLYRWDETTEKPVSVTNIIQSDRYTVPADAIVAAQTLDHNAESLFYFEDDHMTCGYNYPRSNSKLVERWLDSDGKTVRSRGDLCSTYFGWADSQQTRHMTVDGNAEENAHPVLCKFADRERPRHFKFIKHEMMWSEPRVYAAIAAAPYYEGLTGWDKAQTVWGHEKYDGEGSSSTDKWGASIIAGFEHGFTVPLTTSKAGAEFTARATASLAKTSGHMQTIAYGQSYTSDQVHRVVVQATPYDVYTYEIIDSEDPDELGMDYVMSMPGERKFYGFTLEDYTRLVGDQLNVSRPRRYLKGKPGIPGSYPTNYNYERELYESEKHPFLCGRGLDYSERFEGVGTGGSTTRSISLKNDSTKTTSVELGAEVELVISTASGVKFGAGFNYNHSNEGTHQFGEEFSVAGTVPGLPSLNDPDHPEFDWNIYWYYVTDEGGTYPVVNYAVKMKNGH